MVVEGVSAVGKTTWCARHGSGNVVAETGRLSPPPHLNEDDIPQFWHEVNCARWVEAVAVEAKFGSAMCDTDPLKLHYDYCLARLGLVSWDRFEVGVELAAASIAACQLGIADIMLVGAADDETLLRQRDLDTTRGRSSFDLHRRLGPALGDWYRTLADFAPSRVTWEFPSEPPPVVHHDRYDVNLFERWMGRLPRE